MLLVVIPITNIYCVFIFLLMCMKSVLMAFLEEAVHSDGALHTVSY